MANFATTLATLTRSKRPLSQARPISLTCVYPRLQLPEFIELALEQESAGTFEFIVSQIRALREAFKLLSDVVVDEVDGLKAEAHAQREQLDFCRQKLSTADSRQTQLAGWARGVRQELGGLRGSLERELGAEQLLTRRAIERNDSVSESHSERINGLREEVSSLRQAALTADRRRDEDMALVQQALEMAARSQAQAEEERAALKERATHVEATLQELAATLAAHRAETEAKAPESQRMGENLGDAVEVVRASLAATAKTTILPRPLSMRWPGDHEKQ